MNGLGRAPADLWVLGGWGGGGSRSTGGAILDTERYSDVEMNPYVYGSAAFNFAHGLPAPTMDYQDRREAAFVAANQVAPSSQAVTTQAPTATVTTPPAPVQQFDLQSLWPVGVLVAIWLLLK